MRVETVTFEKFADVSLLRASRVRSVFVLWDESDELRPKVLSHGTFLEQLEQLTDADGRLPAKFLGFISLLENHPKRSAPAMAAAIAQLLREVARDVNREPTVPTKRSDKQRVRELCANDELRIDVVGFNPLSSPNRARRLSSPKRISVHPAASGYAISHDWRERR